MVETAACPSAALVKVVVLGAGVMGAATALELTRHGADVTLVDPHGAGSGTSSRGAGLVSEGGWHPANLQLIARSVELLRAKSIEGAKNGHPFRFHQTGSTTLVPAALAPQAQALAKMQAREGAHVRAIAPDDLLGLPRHEHMRVDDVTLAFHYPRDGWALPRLFSEVSAFEAQMDGATIHRAPARLVDGGAAVLIDGERVTPDAVVLAAGVWTRAMLREIGLDAPLLAYRTQALKLSAPRADTVPVIHDAVQGCYLRPGAAHHLVAGNGTTTKPEDVSGWRAEADAEFVKSTLRRVRHRFPYLASRPDSETTFPERIESWAGIDAATPDRLLLAGPHPKAPHLWLLAGGNGYGFMRAPAAAESLAALILRRKPHVDLSPFSPARFDDLSQEFAIREGYSLEQPALK